MIGNIYFVRQFNGTIAAAVSMSEPFVYSITFHQTILKNKICGNLQSVLKLLYIAAVKQFQFQVAMEFIILSINGSVAFINLLGFILLLNTRKVNIFFINQNVPLKFSFW